MCIRDSQRPVRAHDLVAEPVADTRQSLAARRDHLARERVGIDDDGSAFGQQLGHRGLAGPDPAGEAYPQHDLSLIHI